MFEHLDELFSNKNKAYGDAYLKFGEMCSVLFPKGLELKTKQDYVIFGLYIQVIEKSIRLGNLIFNQLDLDKIIKEDYKIESLYDSCDDLAVVSQILKKELQNEKSR